MTVHPEIGSLLTVTWLQAEAATSWVEVEVDPGVWTSSPELARPAGASFQLLVGIPYNHTVTLRVVDALGHESEPLTATTDPIPTGFPTFSLLAAEPDRWEPTGTFLLGSVNGDTGGWDQGQYWMWVIDRQGRLVWAMPGVDEHFTIYLHQSLDGDILWDVSTYWSDFDGGRGSQIHRMKLDGVITETIDAPGMHHCFIELPDRSILWGSATSNSEVLTRRNPDGSEDTVWDCRPLYAELGLTDWCHTNSIYYSEERDTLLLSFPTDRTFVAEVDYETGEELRWFGHIPDAWGFDPAESAFQYQHGATWTEAGTLLVSSQRSPSSIEGLVREYEVDEEEQVLRQLWSFGEGDGIDARYAGEAHRLPGGNTLHNTGTTPRVREITPDGVVVWDLAFEGYRLIGRTTWVEDLYTLAP